MKMNMEMPAMASLPHGLGSPSYHASRGGACELTAGSQGRRGGDKSSFHVIEQHLAHRMPVRFVPALGQKRTFGAA
jgi:hypothetical protein